MKLTDSQLRRVDGVDRLEYTTESRPLVEHIRMYTVIHNRARIGTHWHFCVFHRSFCLHEDTVSEYFINCEMTMQH
jgi:hypothetical protein